MKEVTVTILSFNLVDFNQKFHELGSFLWNMKLTYVPEIARCNNIIITPQDLQVFCGLNINPTFKSLCEALMHGMLFKQYPALHLFKEILLETSIIKV